MTDTQPGDAAVTDNPGQDRYEIRSGGVLAGFADYRREGERVVLVHTEVDPAYKGQGLGTALARGTLDDLRAHGSQVVPACPFIAGFIKDNQAYGDLVAD